ncbi:MAG TPA: phospholipase D-like domain-containing protein [Longimicrobiaceae bacterium]|nr:phospholipase D-like domain-containing protein [Longimicrobiaceae bacterium]
MTSCSRKLAAVVAIQIAVASCGEKAPDAALPVTGPPAAPSAALGAGVTEVTVFNDPYVDQVNWEDYTIHNRIISLVRNTPAGQYIRAAIHSITVPAVTDALLDAHNSGVNVYVVHSGHDNGTQGQRLAAALGDRYTKCRGSASDVEGCISNRSSSLMHSKFFTFSQTVDGGVSKPYVVAVTSANMTHAQARLYNNLVIIGGDQTTYDGYKNVFTDMRYLRKNNNYLVDDPDGSFSSSAAALKSYFSPRADSNGGTSEQASTDVVANTLGYLSGGSGCYVKAAQNMFTSGRDPIADELIRIRKLGCTVQLAYTNMDSGIKARLKDGGVQLRLVDSPAKIHHKYYVVYGTYAGTSGAYRLFTGSHNWSGSALRINDEVLLKLYDRTVINAFLGNFGTIWSRGVAQ